MLSNIGALMRFRPEVRWSAVVIGIVSATLIVASVRMQHKEALAQSAPRDYLDLRQQQYLRESGEIEILLVEKVTNKTWTSKQARQHGLRLRYLLETRFIKDSRFKGRGNARFTEILLQHAQTRLRVKTDCLRLMAAGKWMIDSKFIEHRLMTVQEFVAQSGPPATVKTAVPAAVAKQQAPHIHSAPQGLKDTNDDGFWWEVAPLYKSRHPVHGGMDDFPPNF